MSTRMLTVQHLNRQHLRNADDSTLRNGQQRRWPMSVPRSDRSATGWPMSVPRSDRSATGWPMPLPRSDRPATGWPISVPRSDRPATGHGGVPGRAGQGYAASSRAPGRKHSRNVRILVYSSPGARRAARFRLSATRHLANQGDIAPCRRKKRPPELTARSRPRGVALLARSALRRCRHLRRLAAGFPWGEVASLGSRLISLSPPRSSSG